MATAQYNALKHRWERVKSDRHIFESLWQEIHDLVRPDGYNPNTSVHGRRGEKGERAYDQVFDGTAILAAEQLASALGAYVIPESERWFQLTIRDAEDQVAFSNDALLWLELASDIIYREFAKYETDFYTSTHEDFLDIVALGTGTIFQDWNLKTGSLQFRTIPIADLWCNEDSDGIVNEVWRLTEWSTRQMISEFGEENIPKKVDDTKIKQPDRTWNVIHAVFPRDEAALRGHVSTKKAFASVWFVEEVPDSVMRESGYDEMPYHVARWSKRSGEVYGRSPAMSCLPDNKLLQAMEKTQLRNVQKQVDPPLLVPSTGFMLPIKTSPSSLNYYDPTMTGAAGPAALQALRTEGRYDIGEDKLAQKREHIRQCFFSDWVARPKKKERQTATEIVDDRNEMLTLMGPNIARIHREMITPMITRSFALLERAGRIPPAPPELEGAELKVAYTSPAAVAQLGGKAITMRRFLEQFIPMAQIEPGILDAIDFDAVLREAALYESIPRRIIRDPEEVDAIRSQRQEGQQMQQAAEIAEPATSSILNIAKAQQISGG